MCAQTAAGFRKYPTLIPCPLLGGWSQSSFSSSEGVGEHQDLGFLCHVTIFNKYQVPEIQ